MSKEGTIVYRYSVEWMIWNDVGQEVERTSKPFSSKEKAEAFAAKLKARTNRQYRIEIAVRKLSTNQIVERFKKKHGNTNYQRT